VTISWHAHPAHDPENCTSTLRVQIAGRKLVLQSIEESPCRRACPAGIDVKRYIGQIANGDFTGALATIRRHMPFPSACGRICLHPCEKECKRGDIDEPIAIMHLKRFVHEYESRLGESQPLPAPADSTGKKIAIIGSGPSGLTAAHDLALMGHEVTVFEHADSPGGMMTHAIPEFELPSSAVRRDIERIERLGVKIICGRTIDGESGIDDLRKQGFDAILIATGAQARWKGFAGPSWIPGGDLPGVVGAVEFMMEYRNGSAKTPKALGIVAVLGWGVQALACARTAVRLGCPEVSWIVPVAREHLQPDPRLVSQAEEEGVAIIELSRPVGVKASKGRTAGVKVVGLERGESDHTGRFEYVHMLEDSHVDATRLISCNTIIDAAHFAPDVSWAGLSSGPWGAIGADLDSMATSVPGVFATGDVVSGPKSVVEAVSLGHRGAVGIDRFLSGRLGEGKIGTLSRAIDVPGWEIEDPSRIPSRVFRPSVRRSDERSADFLEAERPFTVWQATREARRCLLCGPCDECAACLSICYRKKGVAQDENGNPVLIRIPLGVARGIRQEITLTEAPEMKLYCAAVDHARCRGCGVCEEICDYKAPRITPDPRHGLVSTIDILACKGCGTCVSACPSGAIDQGVTSLLRIRDTIWGGVE